MLILKASRRSVKRLVFQCILITLQWVCYTWANGRTSTCLLNGRGNSYQWQRWLKTPNKYRDEIPIVLFLLIILKLAYLSLTMASYRCPISCNCLPLTCVYRLGWAIHLCAQFFSTVSALLVLDSSLYRSDNKWTQWLQKQVRTHVLVRVSISAQTSWPRSKLGRKGFIQLTLSTLPLITKGSQDWNSSRSGSRNLYRGHGGMFFTGLLRLAYSACSLIEPKTTSPEMVLPTRGLPLLNTNWENVPQMDLMEALSQLKLLSLW